MKSLAIIATSTNSKEREAHDRKRMAALPGNGPVPPTQGDEHASMAAPMGAAALLSAATAVLSAASGTRRLRQRSDRREEVARRTHVPASPSAVAPCACAIEPFGTGASAFWQATAGGNDSGSSSFCVRSWVRKKLRPASTLLTDGRSPTQTLAEAVAQKALPSVAAIDVYTNQSNAGGMYGFGAGNGSEAGHADEVLALWGKRRQCSTADGYNITNNHVVEGGSAYKVHHRGRDLRRRGRGQRTQFRVAGHSRPRMPAALRPSRSGDSDKPVIGEWVMTIGARFGLEQSVGHRPSCRPRPFSDRERHHRSVRQQHGESTHLSRI